MSDPVLVEVTRGPLVESSHRGAIVIVDASGREVAGIGDTKQRVFPRSAVKALQALPLAESGTADAYGFGDAELALACASHSGEPRHVATAASMLARAGRSVADLECGVHRPIADEAYAMLIRSGEPLTALYDNCSGKHAGVVCTACHRGIDPKGYVRADHPAQREVTAALADMTGERLDKEVLAVDGCSMPTYAIPLDKLALAFARFVTGEGLSPARAAAARRLATACTSEPWMVEGTGRFSTDMMSLFGSRLFLKSGAEGVFCAAFPERGFGVALKCDDGGNRASETAMAAVIDALLPMSDAERVTFADRLVPPVMSRAGARVGEIRVVPELADALRTSLGAK